MYIPNLSVVCFLICLSYFMFYCALLLFCAQAWHGKTLSRNDPIFFCSLHWRNLSSYNKITTTHFKQIRFWWKNVIKFRGKVYSNFFKFVQQLFFWVYWVYIYIYIYIYISKWIYFPEGQQLTKKIFLLIYVYDHKAQDQMSLLDAMNAACEDITDHCRRCVRHSSRFSPVRDNENIRCDVDKNLWPDQQERQDVHQQFFFHECYFVFFCICGNIRNMKCTVIGQARVHFTCNTFVQ